ncbi:hypothetical protein I316_07405 [Kwoniella heveanensis BCC8398]|uniref:Uncharacterized protein n=1 Tax=Kwoniella heveanensis BCC8398 TaxID=1296120 RepID=A0A1B9GJ26_9TREE|nr:hypothetical protein I316_07405 [Kwoniella heveanensis BCC8398]
MSSKLSDYELDQARRRHPSFTPSEAHYTWESWGVRGALRERRDGTLRFSCACLDCSVQTDEDQKWRYESHCEERIRAGGSRGVSIGWNGITFNPTDTRIFEDSLTLYPPSQSSAGVKSEVPDSERITELPDDMMIGPAGAGVGAAGTGSSIGGAGDTGTDLEAQLDRRGNSAYRPLDPSSQSRITSDAIMSRLPSVSSGAETGTRD